jgi:hypothetical protein
MLPANYQIRQLDPSRKEAIVAICKLVYLTEWPYTVEEFENHRQVFPQGQFVAIEASRNQVAGVHITLRPRMSVYLLRGPPPLWITPYLVVRSQRTITQQNRKSTKHLSKAPLPRVSIVAGVARRVYRYSVWQKSSRDHRESKSLGCRGERDRGGATRVACHRVAA